MQSMSTRWLPAMQADELTIVSYGEVWSPPAGGNPAGSFLGRFQVTTGSLTIDATNAIRRTAQNVTLVPYPTDSLEGYPPGLTVPNVNTDLLFPRGNEMILYKGCRYSDGTSEVATLGRLLMEDVEIYRSGSTGLYITLNGRDRGGTIGRAKFTVPYATDGVSTLDVQLRTLINAVVPNLTYAITPSAFVPAAMNFNIGDDPWTSALTLAASGGYELFPDPQGIITARPVLDPRTLPIVAIYDTTDTTHSIVTSIQRSLVTTAVPNVIIATSQGSGVATPLISYWWDSDSASPSFYNSTVPVPGSNMTSLPSNQGTYPTTVATITGAAATTQLQNDTIAAAAGLSTKGTFETIDLKIRDNPAHDVEDVITANDPAALITPKNYCLDTVTIPLDFAAELEMKGRLVSI